MNLLTRPWVGLRTLTDQPGRWAAVCVFSPWLMYRGCVHGDPGIAAFALLLFSWDLYWLAYKPPLGVKALAAGSSAGNE